MPIIYMYIYIYIYVLYLYYLIVSVTLTLIDIPFLFSKNCIMSTDDLIISSQIYPTKWPTNTPEIFFLHSFFLFDILSYCLSYSDADRHTIFLKESYFVDWRLHSLTSKCPIDTQIIYKRDFIFICWVIIFHIHNQYSLNPSPQQTYIIFNWKCQGHHQVTTKRI